MPDESGVPRRDPNPNRSADEQPTRDTMGETAPDDAARGAAKATNKATNQAANDASARTDAKADGDGDGNYATDDYLASFMIDDEPERNADANDAGSAKHDGSAGQYATD